MSRRRLRRRTEKQQRHTSPASRAGDVRVVVREPTRVERLAYTRRQAAEALGISTSTFNRRVLPFIETPQTDWARASFPRQRARARARRAATPATSTTQTACTPRPQDRSPARDPPSHSGRARKRQEPRRDRTWAEQRWRGNLARWPPVVAFDRALGSCPLTAARGDSSQRAILLNAIARNVAPRVSLNEEACCGRILLSTSDERTFEK